ncbi:MAG: sigma 54-interacting transcriptional regulator [Myxococcales bacterium]|nr:sigma 54-interacting transcriptional regulator [Myxococcales bacterium]
MAKADAATLLELALEQAIGPALVLDRDLRIIAAAGDVAGLLGSDVPIGVAAPKILCGTGDERPIAEAMAEGRPVSADVPRPGRDGEMVNIQVRAVPLLDGEDRIGWLLSLSADSWAGDQHGDAVEFHGIWTRDPSMKTLLRDVGRVARRDVTVLVRGETGTGKELVARAIHLESTRSHGPFVAINCAALPPQLLESELFGHVRGAFTGAVKDSPGQFRVADGGTIFLDEIGELSLDLQAKLLRVLQEKSVIPVGGRAPVPVDVRIVSATHRSLREAVDAGEFRADLMYRIRVVPLFLLPLRERRSDIMLLVDKFIEMQSSRGEREIRGVSPGGRLVLERYDWPGNVRELQNVIEYAFAMGEGPILTESDLPPELLGEEPGPRLANRPRSRAARAGSLEADRIAVALERAAGHRGRAAQSLGMSRATLWRRMKQHGLLD